MDVALQTDPPSAAPTDAIRLQLWYGWPADLSEDGIEAACAALVNDAEFWNVWVGNRNRLGSLLGLVIVTSGRPSVMLPKELIVIEDGGSEANGKLALNWLRNPQSNETPMLWRTAPAGIPAEPGLNLLNVMGLLAPTLIPGA